VDVATIKKGITEGARVFLLPEISPESDLDTFEKFATKLGTQIPLWTQMKDADKAEKAKGGDNEAVYDDRIKADDLAIKAITDFKTTLETEIINKWKADDSFTIDKTVLDDAEAQYHGDYVKALAAHALTFLKLDADKPEEVKKYQHYIDNKKVTAGTTKPVEEGKEDGSTLMLVIGGAIGFLILIGVCIGISKCKKSKKDTDYAEMH